MGRNKITVALTNHTGSISNLQDHSGRGSQGEIKSGKQSPECVNVY